MDGLWFVIVVIDGLECYHQQQACSQAVRVLFI